MINGWWARLILLALFSGNFAQAGESLTIIPAKFTLSGSAARQQLLLEHVEGKQFVGQVTEDIAFTSSNSKIVQIVEGAAVPVGNGTATLTARHGKRTATTQVTVVNFDQPFEWSFRNHVQPVLAKAGCSSGACHGAAAGQGGFKLSLRGYDNDGDFRAITRQALGRRIVPVDPGRSLLLLKPTIALPHKGGQRFETDSLEYRVVSEWIAAGTPAPKPDEPRIHHLEFLPANVILKPGVTQQLIVRAHFSDGQVQDVTRWVKYTDANAAVTQVNETGNVKVLGHGEGAITAWYLSRIAIATISVPYENKVKPEVFARAKKRNFIDELVLEKLRDLKLPPSPTASDSEFIRRAFVDTIGLLPTAQETRDFLARKSRKKRDELIESLLNRPEFVDYWSFKWSDLLLVNSDKLRPPAMWAYYNWIRDNVAANTPWNQFVSKLVTAKGSTLENGAANFFVLHEDPPNMAETTSVAFLGMSINCAKCHNHPMEKWTNDEYFGFANLFARVRTKSGTADGDRIIFAATQGDLVQPLRGKPQPPRPLDGKALSLEDPGDRREALAEWLTSRDNPYFTRAIVNRIWANFLGVGLVVNVDDLRVTNPASNEKLLSAAAKYLADQSFDLKALMRTILQSETYQRSSQALPENAADRRFYSHFYPRRMMAEVLLDALSEVTAVPTDFSTDVRNANRTQGDKYPAGFRALQLPDSRTDSYFLKSFGRAPREVTCECERSAEPSMAQALHLANGDTVNHKLAAKDNRIGKWLTDKLTREQMIEEACLSALSRFPTAAEKEQMLKTLTGVSETEQRVALEDVLWAMITSREFLFNH